MKTTDYEHTIEKLNENEQYLFRILAINSRGASEPKEMLTAVTVQEQRGENILTSSNYIIRNKQYTRSFYNV